MTERYATKKVTVASVQGNTNRQTTGTNSSFHWVIQEKATGETIEGPFAGQAEAEQACLKLNYPRP